jgi:hypothetical protein
VEARFWKVYNFKILKKKGKEEMALEDAITQVCM